MTLNLFGKKKTAPKQTPPPAKVVEAAPAVGEASSHALIKHFYVSEKASRLMGMNQYVFKVAAGASKQEIKALVSKLYRVAVKDIKMINLPRKRKDLGRYPGFRSGFRKAVVILEKGNTIDQAGV